MKVFLEEKKGGIRSENFYFVGAFASDHGGGAHKLSGRTLDLANFAEAMLIPTSSLAFVLGLRLVFSHTFFGIGLLMLFVSVFTFRSLRKRYLYLRGDWVKINARGSMRKTREKR